MKRAYLRSLGGACGNPGIIPRGKEPRVKITARKSTGGIWRPPPLPSPQVKYYGSNKEQNPHCKPVLESHLDLLNQGTFSDVTFIVGEGKERIPSHQIFLKARSSVFAEMFTERWNQDSNQEVQLNDVCPETFKQFLEFIYADTFKPEDVSETLELLHLAHKFDVKLLVSECEEVLESEVRLNDALEVFQAARTYGMESLMDRIGELWAESLSEMQTHSTFRQLDKQALMFILKRKDLELEEVDLFRLALKWAENQKDITVEQSLEHVLPLIRFPLMTLEEFTATVVPTKLLPPSTVIQIFKYFGSDSETKESLEKTLGFRAQERQPEDPTFYVPLYPKEEEDNPSERKSKVFGELKECLQLCNLQIQPEQLVRGIGLRSVSVYCPSDGVFRKTTGGWRETASRTFQIRLKSKGCRGQQFDLHCKENYTKLLKMDQIHVEEDEVEDIEFDDVIPLKAETIYSIEIEETDADESTDGESESYWDYADFGTHFSNNLTVSIDNICRATLNVHRNKLQGFEQDDSELPSPRLICRLGFEEL